MNAATEYRTRRHRCREPASESSPLKPHVEQPESVLVPEEDIQPAAVPAKEPEVDNIKEGITNNGASLSCLSPSLVGISNFSLKFSRFVLTALVRAPFEFRIFR